MKKDDLDITSVTDVLAEAHAIAKGVVDEYLPTISVSDGVLHYFPFGVGQQYHYEEVNGNGWGKLVIDEDGSSAAKRVASRFIEILDGCLRSPPQMPTSAALYGESTPMKQKQFLMNIARHFKRSRLEPLINEIFKHGKADAMELDMLVDCLNGAAEQANELLAGDVKISPEHAAVLKMWQELGSEKQLQFMEVAELFCRYRKVQALPNQCSEPGAFLYRFAKKTGKPGGRAPWMLRESAKSRKLLTILKCGSIA